MVDDRWWMVGLNVGEVLGCFGNSIERRFIILNMYYYKEMAF